MPRFTISHHTGGPEGDHFDLFLEKEAALKTWRVQRMVFEAPQTAVQTDDHRIKYLDYEGVVSGARGEVKLWDTGTYTVDAWKADCIAVAVRGSQLKTRLRMDLAETEGQTAGTDWRLSDPTVAVRRLAAAMLRGSSLDVPPAPELEEILRTLSGEEQALMGLVQAFSKGEDVAWAKAVTSPALRERLQSERARWRHPWIEAAVAQAGRLDEIAKAILAAKP